MLCFLYLFPRDWTGQSIKNSGHNKKCNTPAYLKPSIRNRQPKNCIPFYSEKQYSKGLFRISNWKGGKKFSLSLTHKIWELPVGQGFISGGNSRVLSSHREEGRPREKSQLGSLEEHQLAGSRTGARARDCAPFQGLLPPHDL